jgi:hypothetical protein
MRVAIARITLPQAIISLRISAGPVREIHAQHSGWFAAGLLLRVCLSPSVACACNIGHSWTSRPRRAPQSRSSSASRKVCLLLNANWLQRLYTSNTLLIVSEIDNLLIILLGDLLSEWNFTGASAQMYDCICRFPLAAKYGTAIAVWSV